MKHQEDPRPKKLPSFDDIVVQVSELVEAGKLDEAEAVSDIYPEHADRLRRIIPAIAALATFDESIEPTAAATYIHGRELGDFRIVREIGRGGMGIVYEAEQLSLGRRMALKVLPLAATLSVQQLERFKNEARLAASLKHPNIVSVHSVGVERGVHYYAMELIEGCSLAQAIADLSSEGNPTQSRRQQGSDAAETSPIAALSTARSENPQGYFRQVARLIVDAADALDYAHDQGIVHRDIKPGNLLLDADGRVHVTDFGLARLEADAGVTLTGDVLGTLRYMSPEQAAGNTGLVDARTDIHALGATLYELLVMRPAFAGNNRAQLLRQIADGAPLALRQVNPQIPVDLETITAKALEKEPADRYPTAGELAADLRAFVEDRPISAQPPTIHQRLTKWSRRHARLAFGIAATVTLLFAVSLIGLAAISHAWSTAHQAQKQTAIQRDQAIHNLYVADVRLAHEEWNNAHYGAFQTLLDAQLPQEGVKDLRGWEWYYLKSLGVDDAIVLKGHERTVADNQWKPGSSIIATAGFDHTIRLWDATTGKEIRTLARHDDKLQAIAWSPDGRRLASTAWDNTTRVWDADTGEQLVKVADFGFDISWSPDGERIAICSGGVLAAVYDADTGQEFFRVPGRGIKWSIAYSADGTRLAVGGQFTGWEQNPIPGRADGQVCTLDAATGEKILDFQDAHELEVNRVAWSLDSSKLASVSTDHSLKVWNAETGEELFAAKAHDGTVVEVAWSPTADQLATAAQNGEVKIWRLGQQVISNSFLLHEGPISALAWSPDGQFVASGSSDATCKIWRSLKAEGSVAIPARGGMAWRPDGNEFVVAAPSAIGDRCELQLYSFQNGELAGSGVLSIGDASHCPAVAWSPDGTLIAFAYDTGSGKCNRLGVINRLDGKILFEELLPDNDIRCLAWHPDGRTIAIGFWRWAQRDEAVAIWDVSKGTITKHLAALDSVESLAWSPKGDRLAAAHPNQDITLWSSKTWRQLAKLNRHPGQSLPVAGGDHMLAWNKDGNILIAGTGRGWVIQWNTATGREIGSFKSHQERVRSIAISPNESRLATASSDGTIKVWDAVTGDLLLTLRGHKTRLRSIEWSPDGKRILSVDTNELRLWDASAGYRLASSPTREARR